ncbi:MAG: YbaB/EbfC family nucleoid-associated protein [bacterium]|nr:YbaB/EbfC family nucleoid-associated protein [bacterium]
MPETESNPENYKQVVSFTKDLDNLLKVRREVLETIDGLCAPGPPETDVDDVLIVLRELAQVLERAEEDLRSNLVNLKMMYGLVVKQTELLDKELDRKEKEQLKPAADLFDVDGLDDLGEIDKFAGSFLVKEMLDDVKKRTQIDKVLEEMRQLKSRKFETTFHDGKVTVRMDASCKVLSFGIDRELLDDPQSLGEIVVETVNGTMDTVRDEADRLLSQLPLPPSPLD